MTYNRITAEIGESRRITTRPISYQYDTAQILMLTAAEGVELPEFYQVDFCVIGDEDTVTMVGSLSGGAPIPDSLLRQGENLMAYLVLTGTESDVQTRYEITIPVNERPTRSGIELSDDQQAQVDSLVEALNEGVDRAEAAAESIQDMGVEAETLAAGSEASVEKTVDPETGEVTLSFGIPKGPHGDPGYSPTIQIATITGGHRITVTDSQGSASFDVMDGEQGDPGAPGDDGYSPAVTITQITNGHRVTITDKTHQSGQTFDVMDGEQGDPGTPGDDGYSPAVTITTITGGHRVTITDEDHPTGQSFDVMDGASDAGQVSYDQTQTYQSGTVGKELSDQKNALNMITVNEIIEGVGGNLNLNSDNKIISTDRYVSVVYACTANRTYTVTRAYGNRFLVACTTQYPSNGVVAEKIVSDSSLNEYTFVTPSSARYCIVVLQNDYAGVSEHSHEEIINSCNVCAYTAVDYDAREASEQTLVNYEQLLVDANNSDYWVIMGIGSYGENYTTRNWNISTDAYLSNIVSVTTDDGYATRYVLYNSNKEFIFRSGFSRKEIGISSVMKEYSATYVRFEVQALDESGAEITTPIDNVSRYAHVHLYVLRDSGIKIAGASKKWYEDSIVQSTYLDRIKQAKYVYANTDSGVSTHPVLTLLHFSDVHGNVDAMRYALDINKMFESDIDDMLHTGDVVTANLSDGISNWISSGCADKVLNVIGNHDTEENLVLQAAGKDNVYNTLFAPYITQWGVIQPTGVNTTGSDNYHALYYYKDYSSAEVRLIILDTNFWDEAQKSWLASVLADAKTNEMCVVIACHNVKLLTEMTDSNFSSYKGDGIIETGNSYANQPSDWLDPVNDFINNGGNFACILAGHNHDGHMGTMTNYPNIFVYVSDKASVSRVSGAARITGEMNANAVSIVVINPVEKLFKIVKIGAQIDGKMRPQNVFCYDYANKKIVSQW